MLKFLLDPGIILVIIAFFSIVIYVVRKIKHLNRELTSLITFLNKFKKIDIIHYSQLSGVAIYPPENIPYCVKIVSKGYRFQTNERSILNPAVREACISHRVTVNGLRHECIITRRAPAVQCCLRLVAVGRKVFYLRTGIVIHVTTV